jgi:hypothetical protein
MEIKPGQVWVSKLGIWGRVTVVRLDEPGMVIVLSSTGYEYPIGRSIFIHWFRKLTKLEQYLDGDYEG